VLPDKESVHDDVDYSEIMNYENTDMAYCSDLELDDIHLIIHTGGTTGLPKGGMISHHSLILIP